MRFGMDGVSGGSALFLSVVVVMRTGGVNGKALGWLAQGLFAGVIVCLLW